MNIAIVSAYYPPHMGGVETFAHNLARTLASSGHAVTVITSKLDNDPPRESFDDGVQIFRLPTWNLLHSRFPLLKPRFLHSNASSDLRQLNLDAVIVNTRFYPLSRYGARLAHHLGLTSIIIEHGSSHLTIGNAFADRCIRAYEHFATAIIKRFRPRFFGVSNEALEWLEHFGIEGEGIFHNAIDAESFVHQSSHRNFRKELGIPADDTVVAFTGRIVSEKGIWILAKVAEEFYERGARFHFLVAGDGPELVGFASTCDEQPNMHVLGRLSRPDVAALLLDADAFCFPSSYPEGLPTSLLEAAACGTYIVVSKVGGALEIVPSCDYGTVVNETNPHAFVSALLDYDADQDSCTLRARACRERVLREFSWEKTAEAVLKAIQQDC